MNFVDIYHHVRHRNVDLIVEHGSPPPTGIRLSHGTPGFAEAAAAVSGARAEDWVLVRQRVGTATLHRTVRDGLATHGVHVQATITTITESRG